MLWEIITPMFIIQVGAHRQSEPSELLFWEDNSGLRLTKAYIADISRKLTLTKYDYRSECWPLTENCIYKPLSSQSFALAWHKLCECCIIYIWIWVLLVKWCIIGSYYRAMPTINSSDHPEHPTHAHGHVCITRTLRVQLAVLAQCLHISADQSEHTTNCSSSSAIPPLTLNVTLLRWETTPDNTDTCVLHKLSVSG